MSETSARPGAGGSAEDGEPQFDINKVYTKDLSFETPNSPDIFRVDWQPDVNINLSTEAAHLDGLLFEVVLAVTVTAKVAEQTAFLVEVQQAGIFTIAGVPDDEMGQVLSSLCPGILFPYAREVVSDLVVRGGFPQVVLTPVNFDALYYKHTLEQQGGGDNA
ncbi:MAG: protein-export chaperone SecB [Gammaproteobacteria bacterium]|nr:protein-export chaperone SecB [Gammaproteobacteria bacterium]